MITHFYTQIHKIKPCFGWVWKNYLNACLPTFLSFDPFLFFEIIFLLRIEPRVAQKISKCLIGGRLKPRWWSKSCLCKSCSICFVRGRVRETIDWTLRENIYYWLTSTLARKCLTFAELKRAADCGSEKVRGIVVTLDVVQQGVPSSNQIQCIDITSA